jgi:hypothetical protein
LGVARVPTPGLHEWQNFFMILGTASATLIGAMFVVVSIGTGILTRERTRAVRAFLSSTVTSLSTVLMGAALTMVPVLDWFWLATIVGLAGLAGLAYSVWIIVGFGEHPSVGRDDWFWYAIFPPIGYALLVAAAAAASRAVPESLVLLAAALAILLIGGIRNAWDMIVFLVTRSRDSA